MKLFNAGKSAISPFLQGIARNFDFAGSISNFPGRPLGDSDALTNDWKMVGSDYFNSIRIINEELNETKNKTKK